MDGNQDDHFYQSVARTTAEVIRQGNTDPTGEKIAEAYFEQPVTVAIIVQITGHLPYICDIVRDKHLSRAHLVNSNYYDAYFDQPPQTREEAKMCIPGGKHRTSAGIRVPSENRDLIYRETQKRHSKSGAKKVQKRIVEVKQALVTGQMTPEDAVEIAREWAPAARAIRKLKTRLSDAGVLEGPLFQGEANGKRKEISVSA